LTDFTATLPRKRMGAGLLMTNPSGRVLLVEPVYRVDWEIPGGAVEADESPCAATIREIGEELGLVVAPGRLLVVDWVPPRDGRTEGLMLLFDSGVLTPEQTGSIRLPPEELRSWVWCDQQQAQQRLSALLARRVAPLWKPAPAAARPIWKTDTADPGRRGRTHGGASGE
jgi:8-oxo-dGTP diphosphatase